MNHKSFYKAMKHLIFKEALNTFGMLTTYEG